MVLAVVVHLAVCCIDAVGIGIKERYVADGMVGDGCGIEGLGIDPPSDIADETSVIENDFLCTQTNC